MFFYMIKKSFKFGKIKLKWIDSYLFRFSEIGGIN